MQTASWVKYNILVAVLIAGLAAPVGATVPDAWITTKTKLAMLTTEGVSGTQVNVDTILGRVTLHGKVSSADEKVKAETIAQKIVDSNLLTTATERNNS